MILLLGWVGRGKKHVRILGGSTFTTPLEKESQNKNQNT